MEKLSAICRGGPMDGETVTTVATMIVLAAEPGMAYHWTRPTDTNWRETIDHDWWMHGTEEPAPPAHVWEWHEESWRSPEVRMIREAIDEASARLLLGHGSERDPLPPA